MSVPVTDTIQTPTSNPNINKLAVSFRLLLALYAVIPISLILYILDKGLWNDYLLNNLPTSPKGFLLFQVLFGTPHIVASAIILTSNKEYFLTFRTKIILMTLAIALFFGIGNFVLPYHFMYILVASWTVYHVLKQQHGIARGVCKLNSRQFYMQLWLSIIAGILVYIGIFMKNSLSEQQAEIVRYGAALFCFVLIISTSYVHAKIPTAFGKAFLWANTFLVLSSFFLYIESYYFLAILVPRLVHDATAYTFYVVHDYNRHSDNPQNFIFRAARRIKIHIFLVLPTLSFGLAYVLQQYGDQVFDFIMQTLFETSVPRAITLGFLGYLALMHYYTESFTWKGDSPYRRYIRFCK